MKFEKGDVIVSRDGEVGTVESLQEPNPPWHDGGAPVVRLPDGSRRCWPDAIPCPRSVDGTFVVRIRKVRHEIMEVRLAAKDGGLLNTEALRDAVGNVWSHRRGLRRVLDGPELVEILDVQPGDVVGYST